MQRTIDLTTRAEREVARRLTRRKAGSNHDELYLARTRSKAQRTVLAHLVRTERSNRRDDWACGPGLRPRRDIGAQAERHGTVSDDLRQGIVLPPHDPRRKEPLGIAKGDRVVILDGRDRGKIGEVATVSEESRTCTVKALNRAEFFLSEAMRKTTGDSRSVVEETMHMPLSHVRLVHALRNKDGTFRDVVVDNLVVDVPHRSRNTELRGTRSVPGTEIVIPWPTLPKPAHETHPDDTPRLNVDVVSHKRPVLLSAPMPPSVLDELRNKYSRFRTRHEPAYVARKEAEARALELRREGSVSTPSVEAFRLRQQLKKESASAELGREHLIAIGRAIAKEREAGAKTAVNTG